MRAVRETLAEGRVVTANVSCCLELPWGKGKERKKKTPKQKKKK